MLPTRQLEVDSIPEQLFLAGISTRRLHQLSEELWGRRVSATTISKTAAHLAEELEQHRTAPIANEEMESLFLDGMSERVGELGVERKPYSALWAGQAQRRNGFQVFAQWMRKIQPVGKGC